MFFEFPAPHKYKPVLRDVLLDCPKSEGASYSEYKRKIFELVPPGGYWRDIPEDIAKEYMKSCWHMEAQKRFAEIIRYYDRRIIIFRILLPFLLLLHLQTSSQAGHFFFRLSTIFCPASSDICSLSAPLSSLAIAT